MGQTLCYCQSFATEPSPSMPNLSENPQAVLTATFLLTDSPSAGTVWAVSVLLPVFFTVPSQVAVGCSYNQVSITEV